MDTVAEKQGAWKTRDAWFCVLGLIVSQSVLLFWLRLGARSSPAFSHWWATAFGSGVIYIIQDALWLFVALWFSRVEAVRDFLEPAGLRRGVSVFGWGAAWLAIAVSFIDGYGASKGWTASSKLHQPASYGSFSMTWCYFTLSAVLIDPFCEEVVTRGFLYRAFRGRYSPLVTTVIIICFSAYFHWGSVSRSAFTFGCLASLWALLCIVRERTSSLWDCLLCHAVYNLGGIYHSIPTIIVMILFLLFVMRLIFGKQRVAITGAPDREA